MRRLVFDEKRTREFPANSCYMNAIILESTRAQEVPLLNLVTSLTVPNVIYIILTFFWKLGNRKRTDELKYTTATAISYYKIITVLSDWLQQH